MESPMKDVSRKLSFVVGFNRDRDSYQVPLALAEAGWLETFVTDYYSSARRAKLFPRLGHRQVSGLDTSLTRGSALAMLISVAGPKVLRDADAVSLQVSRTLGMKARTVARRTKADLLLYSEHAYEAFSDPKLSERRRILFSFHPHRKLIREILDADRGRFPDIDWEINDAAPFPAMEHREDEELRLAQQVLCASSFTRQSLIHAGVPDAKIEVIPYGTTATGTYGRVGRRSDECRFLFVGQGVQRKGLHHLLHVWNRLVLPNASLTVVSYRLDPALAKLVGTNVKMLSTLPARVLDEEFARSHVFVMPSLVEGFGLVFLEAMSAGCHVIGTENTGLPDLEMPADFASIVEAGSLDQLAVAMESAYVRHQASALPHDEISRFAETRSWTIFRERLRRVVSDFMDAPRS
jgi:glycosyltransferase involved in cell wall biosynthesis